MAARPGAALDSETGRLVEHEERVVLEQNARAQPFGIGGIHALGCALLRDGRRRRRRQRRDADALARMEARISLRAPAIHPDLPRAQ